ncbi:MAG: hypothetical protein NTY37_10775 [Methanothrix sp.]|nr:hypothetical protein [Methanothrix sp.]
MVISGICFGELLLNFTVSDTAPVFSGGYSYDIVGINIPPISSFNTSSDKKGYSYSLPGVYIPGKPNDFIVSASKVKNLNIGLKKDPVKTSTNLTRIWITSQVQADKNNVANATSDLLSPGRYQAKLFGDAAENVSQVNLTMTFVKKIIVNGRFNFSINTEGFPLGNYSINIEALNGSIRMDKLAVDGLLLAK